MILHWERIKEWIVNQGVPDDAQILLATPIDPITGELDGRLWIEVISEEWGLDNTRDAYDPMEGFDPVYKQYHLIPVDLHYRLITSVEDLLDGLDANYDGRDGLSMKQWEERIKYARETLKRL